MSDVREGVVRRFILASAGFERRLRQVRPRQWDWPTPCPEWSVRQLVNHMVRGNENYLRLVRGGNRSDFLRLRDVDALGTDPVGSYTRSVRRCAGAFSEPGALGRVLDYPGGRVGAAQALAVRTTDSVVHTWDLARAIGVDDSLDAGLLGWISLNFEAIYEGLAETPTDRATTHRFFAPPPDTGAPVTSGQDQLLLRVGRDPRRADRWTGYSPGGGAVDWGDRPGGR